jgi:hypothetical protein
MDIKLKFAISSQDDKIACRIIIVIIFSQGQLAVGYDRPRASTIVCVS